MTFLSRTYNTEFNAILNDIKKLSEQAFVTTIIGKPQIPQLALALMYLFFKEKNEPSHHIRTYCASTVLMQMGLDTHSQVTNFTSGENGHRERQMRVLVGDLYSGKFYQLLAYHGAVKVIHYLSDAICRINEAKANVYHLLSGKQVNVKQYLVEIEQIGSSLFNAWLTCEPSEVVKNWRPLVTNLLTAERLQQELTHTLPSVWPFNVISQLKRHIPKMVDRSRYLLGDWPSKVTKRELEHLIDRFFPDCVDLGRTAEDF